MNPACSASLLMNDTDVRFHLLHTYILKRVLLAVFSASAVSLNEDINTWTTSPELLGESHHIYIGYRNLKGPHGNLSKYKFGLAEYITVYVIQLQQLLQLLLRIITQYTKYVYFKFYKMFTECFCDLYTYVINNITVYLMLLLLTVFRIKDMFKSI